MGILKVVVRPVEEDLEEIVDAFKRVERGEDFHEEKIVVESLDVLRKILTPERLRILQAIRNERPGSIFQEPLNLTKSGWSISLRLNPHAFQSPFSGAFESYRSRRLLTFTEITSFNLHFQEPLNLTDIATIFKAMFGGAFNLHFQEPLNLTPPASAEQPFNGRAFNLHFQEPLNLTGHTTK